MSKRGKKPFIFGGMAIILAAFGYLILGGLDSNMVYFLTPSEVKAKGDNVYERPIRLSGQVAPGSVHWNAEALDLRFAISDGTHTIPVHSTNAPPQMFREGIGAVVEGKLNRDGVFMSNKVMVKHSNEYKPPHDGQKPQDMYKSLIKDKATT